MDVITGGSPCQDLSVAGKRAGLQGERSGLFLHQIRIIKEMREHDRSTGRSDWFIRPRYAIWENVPGSLSSTGAGQPKGADFQAVLAEFVSIVRKEAPPVPIPQNGWPNAGCISGMGDSLVPFSIAWRLHDAQFWGVPQRRKRIALVADFGGLSAPEILFERKGLRGDFEESGEEGQGTAKGTGTGIENAMCLQGSMINRKEKNGPQGGGINNEVSFTLNSIDRHAVCVGNGRLNQMSMSEQCNTLYTMHDKQAVMTMQAIGEYKECDVASSCKRRDYKDATDLVITAVDNRHGSENSEVTNTLQSKSTGGWSLNYQDSVRTGSVVRRLTPLECERLQGFPDGWTDIGEWVDSKGKKHKDADSPRYKALGNSIALPFWQYLARRICAQYERPVTIGSLFDGIGGFPLVFERCGAKAVWASEIEEFCIAVTKKHFPDEDECHVG